MAADTESNRAARERIRERYITGPPLIRVRQRRKHRACIATPTHHDTGFSRRVKQKLGRERRPSWFFSCDRNRSVIPERAARFALVHRLAPAGERCLYLRKFLRVRRREVRRLANVLRQIV